MAVQRMRSHASVATRVVRRAGLGHDRQAIGALAGIVA